MKKKLHQFLAAAAAALSFGGCITGFSVSAAATDTELDWLVYVYLCGSDLESENGMGTLDFLEMLEADLGSRAAFLVETGGTSYWQNDEIDADVQSRYLITDGEAWLIETKDLANMGESGTLEDFLSAGSENGLTAAHTGLVFWDHGSGSINGVCFDENYDYDSLSLSEIDEALTACGITFDFVGFDACLMSTYETANMLSAHAAYMIGSEEVESGYGWDYEALGTAMGEGADAQTLGKTICDSFYAACEEIGEEDAATLALTDLSAIPQLNESFDAVAASMVATLSDTESLSGISRGIMQAENYGGNNAAEGYTNMVDLGGILKNISEYVSGADEALLALEAAVVYEVHGSGRTGATGLSVYYPLSVQGSSEIEVLEESNPSGNYVEFTKAMVYGAGTGSVEDYSEEGFVGIIQQMVEEDTTGAGSIGGLVSEAVQEESGEESTYTGYLEFAEDPYVNDDGYYTFSLAADSLDYVQTAGFDLIQSIPEQEDVYFYLGFDNNIDMDWESGVGTDNFSGTWPSLPDGQELMYYVLEETDAYTLFTAPVEVNGEETNLRFRWEYDEPDNYDNDSGSFVILGLWNGLDEETGASSREYGQLETGDEICPIYYGFTDEDGEEEVYYGDVCEVGDDFTITEQILREGIYQYCFDIVDIFGNSLYSEPVYFYVDEEGYIELL